MALGGAVGLGVLLAALVYEQNARAKSDARNAEALQALQTACDEKQKRDARTVSMTPDATVGETAPGIVTPGLKPAAETPKPAEAAKTTEPAKPMENAKAAVPGPAPQPELPPGVTPKRQLRMTDYGYIAHNRDLQDDPCTEYYRARFSVR